MEFVALNGIRASPLMAYNGNAVCDCLMAKITKCRIAIQRVERAIAIRCHSMPYNLPTLINKPSFRANIMSVGISLIVVKL